MLHFQKITDAILAFWGCVDDQIDDENTRNIIKIGKRVERLDLLKCGSLTFAQPDMDSFPCLALARDCAKAGGTACPAMNGANEEAVALFLNDEIGFYDIYRLVRDAVEAVPFRETPTLEEILETDRLARTAVQRQILK